MTSNSTPKAANGTQSPNPAKEPKTKSKGKQNKNVKDADANKVEADAYKEPELTLEERQVRKEVCSSLYPVVLSAGIV